MKPAGILLFCLLSIHVQAQKQHSFGVRAGWNYSTLTRTYLDYRHRAYAGVYGELQVGKHIFLQPEFTYSAHGATGVVGLRKDQSLVVEDPHSEYVGFGIIGKMALPSHFRLMLGQYFDQALQIRKPYRSGHDVGITFGAEYKSPLGLGIEVRLKRGLTDQIDSNTYGTFTSSHGLFYLDRNSNLALQLGINYTFGL
jgi:hypothetical protein